jgi:hypothetical protein
VRRGDEEHADCDDCEALHSVGRPATGDGGEYNPAHAGEREGRDCNSCRRQRCEYRVNPERERYAPKRQEPMPARKTEKTPQELYREYEAAEADAFQRFRTGDRPASIERRLHRLYGRWADAQDAATALARAEATRTAVEKERAAKAAYMRDYRVGKRGHARHYG